MAALTHGFGNTNHFNQTSLEVTFYNEFLSTNSKAVHVTELNNAANSL